MQNWLIQLWDKGLYVKLAHSGVGQWLYVKLAHSVVG